MHAKDETIFELAGEVLEDQAETLDDYLQEKCGEMNLEALSGEGLARIECLVKHLGGEKQCDPHCDAVDSSIC